MENFTIEYEKVSGTESFHNVTRSIARKMMRVQYISVGDFFKSISDENLNELLEMVNSYEYDVESELLIISEMLSRGEGVFSESESIMGENVGYLRMIVCGVALARKKLVKVNYENLSFARDMLDRVIIEKIDE